MFDEYRYRFKFTVVKKKLINMNALSNLNPNYYKTVKEGPDGQKMDVVYSTLDDLTIISTKNELSSQFPDAFKVNPDRHLEIYAKQLTLVGDFVMPMKHVRIVTQLLIIQNGDVTIDVSAPIKDADSVVNVNRTFNPEGLDAGTQSGVIITSYQTNKDPKREIRYPVSGGGGIFYTIPPGKNGEAGLDAGEIYLLAEKINKNGFKLNLKAKGGKGLKGQGGMDGQPAVPGKNGKAYNPKALDIFERPAKNYIDGDLVLKFKVSLLS